MKGSTAARFSGESALRSISARVRQKWSRPSSISWVRNGASGSTRAPAASKSRAARSTAARTSATEERRSPPPA